MKTGIETIINKCCVLWGFDRNVVMGKSRIQPIPRIKAMIAYTIRDTFRLPLKKISDILGCNHTTIIYYLKMYDSEYKYNQEFRNFAIAMKGVSSDIRTEFQEELEEELNEIIG